MTIVEHSRTTWDTGKWAASSDVCGGKQFLIVDYIFLTYTGEVLNDVSIVLYMVNKGRNNNLTGQNVSITCCNCELLHIFLYNSVCLVQENTRHPVYRVGRSACGSFVFRLEINRHLLCPSREIYYSLSRPVSSYLLTYICQNSIVPYNSTLLLFFLCLHKAANNVEQLLLLMF